MSQTILQTLFLNNPEIPIEIANFCDSIPEYVQAEQEYAQAMEELIRLVGYEQFSRFESALNSHLSCEVQAYYLFGLGLRREVLSSLVG